jgi:hypothetical protein
VLRTGIGTGDLHLDAAIDQVLHQHHRVVALLHGLRVEVLGQLRQIGGVEVDGDRDVLLRCGELGADLVVEQVVKFGVECRRVSHVRDRAVTPVTASL